MEKYYIIVDNTYNWDEKGFLIGYAFFTQRIIILKAYVFGRI